MATGGAVETPARTVVVLALSKRAPVARRCAVAANGKVVRSAEAEVADLTTVAGVAASADDCVCNDGTVTVGTGEQVHLVALVAHPALVAALAGHDGALGGVDFPSAVSVVGF